MKKVSKEEAIEWYKENKRVYEQISQKVESIIKEIIVDEGISIHEIYSRAKEVSSFAKKIEDSKYIDPKNQITDFSGIRIITYVESDLSKIAEIIEDNFHIDYKNSVDKRESLGIDKVGYRSIHFVAKFKSTRLKLPEYRKFKNICFEIQIRTILQHAWAEIEHDKDYKFSGVLPDNLKRRFKVLAGVLELADREFNEIATAIDNYASNVEESTKQGNLDIKIDSTSLRKYLEIKLNKQVLKGFNNRFPSDEVEKDVLHELSRMGINSLTELDEIIADEIVNDDELLLLNDNFAGILRHVMIIHDAEKYFNEAWQENWDFMNKKIVDIISKKNKDIIEILKKHEVEIHDFH